MSDSNKTCVIFGGASGIGGATAKLLLEREWSVVIASRNPERAEFNANGRVHAVPCDATQFDAIDQVFASAKERFGEVHAAINCVGSITLKPAHLTRQPEYEETIALNLTSAFGVVRAAGKNLVKGGAVVLMSSAAARLGLTNHEAIAAAKGGVIALAQSAAATYAKKGLRFNVVAPGLVDTPLAEHITSRPQALKASESMHPLGRIGSPNDVAPMIAYLVGDESAWVTGQVIGVDGGLGTLKN